MHVAFALVPLVLAFAGSAHAARGEHPPLFSGRSNVTMLDSTTFGKVLAAERTAMVAFVAPWCGHCKKMKPEYQRAADALHPLIPFYAVDCDEEANRVVCGAQEVQGFPTIKSFPRGAQGMAHVYQQDRTAPAFVEFAKSEVPIRVKTLRGVDGVQTWISSVDEPLPRALLLTTARKLPTLWRVLGSNYNKRIAFAVAKDEDGSIAESIGLPRDSSTKVVTWKNGEMSAYDGTMKFEPLTEHFDALIKSSRSRDEL